MSWSSLGNYTFGCATSDGSTVYCYNGKNLYSGTSTSINTTPVITFNNNITCIAGDSNLSKIIVGFDIGYPIFYTGDWQTAQNVVVLDNTTPITDNWFCASSNYDGTYIAISQDPIIVTNTNALITYENGGWGLAATGLNANSLSLRTDATTSIFSSSIYDTIAYISNQSDIANDAIGKNWTKAVITGDGTYIFGITANTVYIFIYQVSVSFDYVTSATVTLGTNNLTDIYCTNDGNYVITCSTDNIYISKLTGGVYNFQNYLQTGIKYSNYKFI